MSTNLQPTAVPGAATTVVTEAPAAAAAPAEAPVYRIQLQPRAHVTFDESVIDNEHLGRKKSNKCCIFHKKRAFGESSSESGEDSDHGHHKTPHAHDCQHRHRKPASQRPTKPHPFVPAGNSGGNGV